MPPQFQHQRTSLRLLLVGRLAGWRKLARSRSRRSLWADCLDPFGRVADFGHSIPGPRPGLAGSWSSAKGGRVSAEMFLVVALCASWKVLLTHPAIAHRSSSPRSPSSPTPARANVCCQDQRMFLRAGSAWILTLLPGSLPTSRLSKDKNSTTSHRHHRQLRLARVGPCPRIWRCSLRICAIFFSLISVRWDE